MNRFYINYGKRALDILLSVTAIVLLSPVLVLASLAIILEDGLPVLFRQNRAGQFNRPFRIYKFRSMRSGTSELPSAVAPVDAITRVGRFIRRTNIDELPQLLNIVKGDMSIVGPRPPLTTQQELLEVRLGNGAQNLRPGLTGITQISGFDGMTETEKGHMDGQYVETIGFRTDARIILRTVLHLFRPQPVY